MIYDDEMLSFSIDAGSGRVLKAAVRVDERFQIQKTMLYCLENEEEWSSGSSWLPIFE